MGEGIQLGMPGSNYVGGGTNGGAGLRGSVKKQQLELDMDQQTGSRSEEEYVKDVYCHTAYLTYMQSTS